MSKVSLKIETSPRDLYNRMYRKRRLIRSLNNELTGEMHNPFLRAYLKNEIEAHAVLLAWYGTYAPHMLTQIEDVMIPGIYYVWKPHLEDYWWFDSDNLDRSYCAALQWYPHDDYLIRNIFFINHNYTHPKPDTKRTDEQKRRIERIIDEYFGD